MNKLKALLLIIGGLSVFYCQAQSSYNSILQSHSVKITNLNVNYCDSLAVLGISSSEENVLIKPNALILKSRIFLFRKEYSKAMSSLMTALEIVDSLESEPTKTEIYYQLAYINDEIGNNADSEVYFTKIKTTGFWRDSLRYINFLSDYAIHLVNKNEMDSAINYLNLVLNYLERHDSNERFTINTYGNLAVIQEINGELEGSRHQYFKLLKYHKKFNNYSDMAATYLNIGGNYLGVRKFDSARYFLELSYKLSDSLGFLEEANKASINLSDLFVKQNKYKMAYYWLEINMNIGNSIKISENLFEIGAIKKDYENQIEQGRERRRVSKEMKEAERQSNIQFFGIFLAIIFLFIFIFYSGKIHLPKYVADGVVFFAFVLLFEFLLVVLDPNIDKLSEGRPLVKLGCNVLLAVCIIPLHAIFERKLKKYISSNST